MQSINGAMIATMKSNARTVVNTGGPQLAPKTPFDRLANQSIKRSLG